MKNVLFFDADKECRRFTKVCAVKDLNYIYFDKTLADTPIKKLKPYLDSEIISVFTHSNQVPNKKLDLFKNLKLITTRSTGVNHIDLNYCQKRHICVSNVPQYGAITVAEFAFGLILSLIRKIPLSNTQMQHNNIHMSQYTGIDLADKTIGIIGTGSIGQHMIRLAQGFGMKVLAFDQQKSLQQYYVNSLDELFQNSDIISLHIPASTNNHHLLNKKAFQKMKKGVYIINTARGDLIDTYALYQAIKDKIVGGAGLDVLENEDFLLHDETETGLNRSQAFLLTSTVNLKLMQLENIIITPHIAFNSIDAIRRINATTCQNIQSFLAGKPINLQFPQD